MTLQRQKQVKVFGCLCTDIIAGYRNMQMYLFGARIKGLSCSALFISSLLFLLKVGAQPKP